MWIIGADYHPGFQQTAFVDTETGELQERRLQHREEAEKFYRDLAAQGMDFDPFGTWNDPVFITAVPRPSPTTPRAVSRLLV
jgi:hypothetical protein